MVFTFNANSWTSVWELSYIEPDENRYTRCVCPLLLDTSAIAILLKTPKTNFDTSQVAGYVSREVKTGLTISNNPDARIDNWYKVYVNKIYIITFNSIVAEYSLVFDAVLSGYVELLAWAYTPN